MSTPDDPMADIRASFFVECEELLEALNDGLLAIEDDTKDEETIHVVFRAVHSIKGGAGAFGLEPLVQFAHRFETVLDQVRAGRTEVHAQVLKAFFLAADHLADLVQICRDDAPLPQARTDELLAELDAMISVEPAGDAETPIKIDFQPTTIAVPLDMAQSASTPTAALQAATGGPEQEPIDLNHYQIEFAATAEMFETGNDPVLLFRTLATLGDLEVHCDASDVPVLAALAPEVPHLRWVLSLTTPADEAEVTSVFDFVEGMCRLDVCRLAAPPHQQAASSNINSVSKRHTGAGDTNSLDATSDAAAPKDDPQRDKPFGTLPKSVVRVDLERIERLVNLVGELVINQAMLSQSLEQSGLSTHSSAMNGLEEFQRLTRDIQDSVMMIRAQPVKSLFQRMSRIVRECSATMDKDVRLRTEGETTEVDKTVIERLADPLTHMIRNAVDHGLECTKDRLAAGKPAQGTVSLSAAHRSGRVVIEVSDDGGGINRDKVMQIATDKGLVAADAQLSDAEIDNLLFLPGFSTNAEVTDLSGRGVGMDVVRTEIQALGGRITISSEPGEGTRFSISLPLTLAVLDGMVIEVAAETLVLPLNLVIETLTLTQSDVQMLHPGAWVVRLRDGFVPVIDLAAELGYRAPLMDMEGCVVLLIAHEDGSRAALLIDNILDQRQVVIKGLDDSLYRAPGIAAATILGDGQIALILDPSDIITQFLAPKNMLPLAANEGMNA